MHGDLNVKLGSVHLFIMEVGSTMGTEVEVQHIINLGTKCR